MMWDDTNHTIFLEMLKIKTFVIFFFFFGICIGLFFPLMIGYSKDDYENQVLGPVWQAISNSYFYILNNITHIFTHLFIHTYFKKLQTILLKLLYQIPP